MPYIHELPGWPEFTWDMQALSNLLADVRHRQGKHLGRMEALGFELRAEANLTTLTDEIVKSSAIEGALLNAGEVRSSIARHFGLDVAGLPKPKRDVEGVVEMMLDATRNCEEPLTPERLFSWHAALFPTGRSGMYRITVGSWRDDATGPMRVVSGAMGNEKVHFQAPAAKKLKKEMRQFLAWFNGSKDLDPVLKAGIAHLWFVTIHPFEDGNGRIARAIADLCLARADQSPERFYSMSAGIEAERKEYYIQLESAQHGTLDITPWLEWFLGCLGRSIGASHTILASVLGKAKVWQKINAAPVNDRQRLVINRMLEPGWEGFLNTSKYVRLAKCSPDTAQRDIKELLAREVLIPNKAGGRSTSYRLVGPDNA